MSRLEMMLFARLPLTFVRQAADLGLDERELLRLAGFLESSPPDPDARIPVLRVARLWRLLDERLPDPALGIRLGGSMHVRNLGIAGYTMSLGKTLRDALNRLTRYTRSISDEVPWVLEQEGDRVQVDFDVHPALTAMRHPVDARLAMVVSVSRELTESEIDPLAVRFPYPRPDDLCAHRRQFRAPLEFECSRAAVVFRSIDLDLPLISQGEDLSQFLEEPSWNRKSTRGDRGFRAPSA